MLLTWEMKFDRLKAELNELRKELDMTNRELRRVGAEFHEHRWGRTAGTHHRPDDPPTPA